jgi:DNA topoisomerase-6 subunit B
MMTTLFADTMSKKKTTKNEPSRRLSGGEGKRAAVTAESLATHQREISVSEFFAKNRHLLGFDNPRKALLTAIKEAVDNSLDACEEAEILPEITVEIKQKSETRFTVRVRDNGPGIVRAQIDNIFGKLLYGSKFHRLRMSRGQQGIGISAAGMYALMTTGKPMLIISKTSRKKAAHEVLLRIDTHKNRAEIVSDTEHPEDDTLFPEGHGTQVELELEGRYQKGKQSVDEYLDQTSMANPHATFHYVMPTGERMDRERTVKDLPEQPKEIKPHPYGIELGTLIQMLERTEAKKLGQFFQEEFCRVGPGKAKEIASKAGLTAQTWVKQVSHGDAEKLYGAIQDVSIMAPPTDCLAPIGSRALIAGLLQGVKAEFFTASTRPPSVYRGNPFQIEAAMAFGGNLPAEETARIIRFANRVPLLYQQSACCTFKAVLETNWRNYGMSQPKSSLPVGPLVVMLHMASVWVPFTSESKEAIADYDEIRKEIKLALSDCGRKMKTYLNRRAKARRDAERRDIFEKYMGETVLSLSKIDDRLDAERLLKQFKEVAKQHTLQADVQFDEDGRPIKEPIDEGFDESVVIVEENIERPEGLDEVMAALIEGADDDVPVKGARNRKRRSGAAKKSRSAKSAMSNDGDGALFES